MASSTNKVVHVITARNIVGARLYCHRCRDFAHRRVVSQHSLQVVSQHALQVSRPTPWGEFEGNLVRGVSRSTPTGCLVPVGCLVLGGAWPWGFCSWGGAAPKGVCSQEGVWSWGCLGVCSQWGPAPRGVCSKGVPGPRGIVWSPSGAATAAGGTHSTGMHSWFKK